MSLSSAKDSLLRRTQALIIGALAATLGLLAYGAWVWDRDSHAGVELYAVSREVMSTRGEIMRLDEVLTNAARMAAQTGDPAWERRYTLSEQALDSALKRARELAPNAYVGGWVGVVDAANAQLVVMERREFALLQEGKREQALALFESAPYAQQKERYASGMGAMSAALEREVARWERDMIERTHQQLFTFAIGAVGLVLVWGVVVVAIGRWRRHVLLTFDARDTTEAELRNHRDALEAAIADRTQALSSVNARLVEEIDQRIKMETVLRVERDRAEEASRAKTEFLANMSHELRTPLNAIIGFSEAMGHELLGPLGHPRYKEYVGGITESGSHLLGIIGDILDIARIESETVTLNETAVDIREEIDAARRLLAQKIEHKAIRFDDQALAADLHVWGDAVRLRQVFVNILSNAVKFTPEKGLIQVRSRITAEGLVLAVTDSGIGIAPSRIESLLSPFVRATPSHDSIGAGAGLGLPIAKALMQAHDGELTIESRPSEGTTIRLVLPKRRLDLAAAASAERLEPLTIRAAG
jgi:signal transduction histidine kinase